MNTTESRSTVLARRARLVSFGGRAYVRAFGSINRSRVLWLICDVQEQYKVCFKGELMLDKVVVCEGKGSLAQSLGLPCAGRERRCRDSRQLPLLLTSPKPARWEFRPGPRRRLVTTLILQPSSSCIKPSAVEHAALSLPHSICNRRLLSQGRQAEQPNEVLFQAPSHGSRCNSCSSYHDLHGAEIQRSIYVQATILGSSPALREGLRRRQWQRRRRARLSTRLRQCPWRQTCRS